MNNPLNLSFDDKETPGILTKASDADLDALTFGVIAFDLETIVRRYNAHESKMAGLPAERVIGHPLFTVVAPCMNNYMVAQRFEDAKDATLDATIDYVLTLRMKPVKVKLRLFADPSEPIRFVLVQRKT